MPAPGTCDPATRGEDHNSWEVVQGPVDVSGTFGWDGVSVRPDCDGPMYSMHLVNSDVIAWYVHCDGNPSLQLPPNTDWTWDQQQCVDHGFANFSDQRNLTITDTP